MDGRKVIIIAHKKLKEETKLREEECPIFLFGFFCFVFKQEQLYFTLHICVYVIYSLILLNH